MGLASQIISTRHLLEGSAQGEDADGSAAGDEFAPEVETRVLEVPPDMHGWRIDRALAKLIPEFSRSYLQQLMELHQDRVWVYQLLHLQQLDLDTFLINAQQRWQHKELQHKVGLCSTPLYVVTRQGRQWRICAGNTL